MRFPSVTLILFLGLAAHDAHAAAGADIRPRASWDNLQTLEYNIGKIAAGLQLYRHFDMAGELRAIADLTPYGQLGLRKVRAFDEIRGCGPLVNNAETILDDKDMLKDYLKIKYDCSSEECVKR